MRQIYVQQLAAWNFAKNGENIKGELSLTVIIPFSILSVVLPLRDAKKKSILSKPKWGAQAVVRGCTAPLASL